MSSYASPAQGSPAVLSDLVASRWTREVALVVGGAGLVGLAAQFSIPLPGTPVPLTLQTFAVLLSGAALGLHRAALSMVLYLLAGAAGVPWYADGKSGFGGPTFGYVVGFIAAAAVVGFLASRGGDRTPLRTVLTMSAGTLAIYAVGVPWLAQDLGIGLTKAAELGMTDFLVGDGIKVLAAAGLLPAAWALVKRTLR